jgi:hypothetical protein
MPANPDSKYTLKDLHQEIDFLDRKIAYCHNQQAFDSEAARVSELHKLETRRESLVKTALAMAGRGVECDPRYLPRSFRQAAAAKVTS